MGLVIKENRYGGTITKEEIFVDIQILKKKIEDYLNDILYPYFQSCADGFHKQCDEEWIKNYVDKVHKMSSNLINETQASIDAVQSNKSEKENFRKKIALLRQKNEDIERDIQSVSQKFNIKGDFYSC
ncbi:MAG: hypothetical protein Q4D78_08735 [Neisseria zoodegmatis]|uniref:hypothetical protein n=1 Tax=Neisseria zoodegmatis TaxID=326523 RepID=UPI0026F270FB|nr:hypothetical protein [Neisseria zoodegmatis]MDO5070259.1 hypothetical protein [Neisseria zoodegmatis]